MFRQRVASHVPSECAIEPDRVKAPEARCRVLSFQFQIRDALKAVRIEATKAYKQYVEEPKTSQRRGRFDMEMELLFWWVMDGVGDRSSKPLSQALVAQFYLETFHHPAVVYNPLLADV